MTETGVVIIEIGNNTGLEGEIQCPDCGDKIAVFEHSQRKIKCSCKVWELEIKAVGQPIKG